jgi:hypothetical protein
MLFRNTLALALLSISFNLALSPARARAEPPPSATATDRDVHNTVAFQFEDDQVQGDLVAPLGEILTVRTKQPKQSLVRARGSFIDKLVRAVETF